MRRRRAFALIFCASIVVNVAAVAMLGVREGKDTSRYVDGARRIVSGEPFVNKEQSYLGFAALIALSNAVSGSYIGVVVLQIVVAGIAACFTFRLADELFGPRAGWLASALVVFNPDLIRWKSYVMTESLYASLILILVFAIERSRAKGTAWRLFTLCILTFVAFLRPNGWIMVLVAPLYWIWMFASERKWSPMRAALPMVAIVAVFIGGAFRMTAFRQGIESESPERWLRQGTVLWNHEEWHVPMPVDPRGGHTLEGGILYGLRHPIASARLAATRVLVELSGIRPYYSRFHNIFVLMWYVPLHALAVYGFSKTQSPLARLMAAVIGAHLLIIALTFTNWDGRFISYVVPLISIFAAGGAITVASRRNQRGTFTRLPSSDAYTPH